MFNLDSFINSFKNVSISSESPPLVEGPIYTIFHNATELMVLCPDMSFEDYLRYSSACKTIYEKRFEHMCGRTDFLMRLIIRAVADDWSNVKERGTILNSLSRMFSNNTHFQEIRLSFKGNIKFNYDSFIIALPSFKKIKELNFAPDHKISCKDFFYFVPLCLNLTDLIMPDLLLDYSFGGKCKSIPQSVKKLAVSRNIPEQDLLSIIGCSVNLEQLSLLDNQVEKCFFNKVIYPSSLRLLNLDKTHMRDKNLQRIVIQCTNLQQLSIRKCIAVTRRGIEGTQFPPNVEIQFVPYGAI